MSKVSDLLSSWERPENMLFCSLSPFILSKHKLVCRFFRWLGLSLLHYSHNWVILPANSTGLLAGFWGFTDSWLISHTVNLNFNLRSFPVTFMHHLHAELASWYYFWKISLIALTLRDCEPRQGRIWWLIHHYIPRTWYLLDGHYIFATFQDLSNLTPLKHRW